MGWRHTLYRAIGHLPGTGKHHTGRSPADQSPRLHERNPLRSGNPGSAVVRAYAPIHVHILSAGARVAKHRRDPDHRTPAVNLCGHARARPSDLRFAKHIFQDRNIEVDIGHGEKAPVARLQRSMHPLRDFRGMKLLAFGMKYRSWIQFVQAPLLQVHRRGASPDRHSGGSRTQSDRRSRRFHRGGSARNARWRRGCRRHHRASAQ